MDLPKEVALAELQPNTGTDLVERPSVTVMLGRRIRNGRIVLNKPEVRVWDKDGEVWAKGTIIMVSDDGRSCNVSWPMCTGDHVYAQWMSVGEIHADITLQDPSAEGQRPEIRGIGSTVRLAAAIALFSALPFMDIHSGRTQTKDREDIPPKNTENQRAHP